MATKQSDMNTKLAIRIAGGVFRFLLNVFFYTVVVMAVVSFSKTAYDFTYQVFGAVTQDQGTGRDVQIKITAGESTRSVANELELSKVIVNKDSFYVKAKLEKASIMPGTYTVNSAMTYDEILEIITDASNSSASEEK